MRPLPPLRSSAHVPASRHVTQRAQLVVQAHRQCGMMEAAALDAHRQHLVLTSRQLGKELDTNQAVGMREGALGTRLLFGTGEKGGGVLM